MNSESAELRKAATRILATARANLIQAEKDHEDLLDLLGSVEHRMASLRVVIRDLEKYEEKN